MSELDDIQPVDDPPKASLLCPVCRNGVALPPEFNLPSVQCPTCGSVFGRLTGQVMSGPMMQAGPYRSPVSPGVTTPGRGAAPMPRGPGYPMAPSPGYPMAPGPAPRPTSKGKVLGVSIGTILAIVALVGVRYVVRSWTKEEREGRNRDYVIVPPSIDEDFEFEPVPLGLPTTQWHPYQNDTWKFRCLFPTKPGESRKDDATAGLNLQVMAEYKSNEYSVECLHDPALAARIAPNPRDHAVLLAADHGDASTQTRLAGEVNARASYRVDTAVGDWVHSVMVVADGENVFVLRCRFAKGESRMAGTFFGSFRLLTAKLGASRGAPDADAPLALYFIGNASYTPGSPYNAVLVARNGGEYTWEVLVDTLPEGIKATVTGDRLDVKGTSTADTGGTLKVRVNSGDESAEYELVLRASSRD